MDAKLEKLVKDLGVLKRKADLAAQKAATAQKAYDEARQALLGEMNQERLDSIRSGKYTALVSPVDVVEVEDWDAFYGWVARKKAYDALQRRPAVRALLDRREGQRGGKIPGVKFGKVRRLTFKVAK